MLDDWKWKPKQPEKDFEDIREGGRVRKGNALYLERYVPGMSYSSCWESPESFAKYIEGIKRGDAWHDSGWESGDDFSGSKNMEQTIGQARYGWPEGAEAASKIRDRVLAENPVRKEPIKYGIAGAYPNVPRAIAGDPMNMRMMDTTTTKKKPTITLVSNMSCPWYVSAQTISNRAASVAAVVDQIEAAGYCCEVIAIATSRSSKKEAVCTSVMIKPSHQPVDIGRLAFGLGNSGMFRRMVFADWGGDRHNKHLGGGLGHIYPMEPSAEFRDQNVYFLPEMTRGDHFDTPEKCSKEGVLFLLSTLHEQGCPAFKTPPKGYKPPDSKKKVIPDFEF